MVPQMVDTKFGTSLSTWDKQPVVTIKKTALRDLQNNNRTVFPKPLGNSPSLKETESTDDAIKILGARRSMSDCLLSLPRRQSPSSNSVNGHLVYVRRKSDAELGKCSTSDKNHSADCPQSEQQNKGAILLPQTQEEPKSTGISAFAHIPVASTMTSCWTPSVPDSHWEHDSEQSFGVNSAASCLENPPERGDLHWRERFIQLQKHLKHCDQSNQEAYVQMLRSFTSVERSRHAVELEKRAIHLLLEEVREIQQMKILNVLEK